ncbi:sensor histidine kinase [Lentzea cavernae]|uniref:histidine kinase n=1 Tax=Lentzea cavernae TaxID=2020703 RepID=A0ABQ3LXD5_9PSEU|nr:histidine kinase [Lentzea cavernae]GHH27789.1 two-component sensor histidine kinase [Lentzea cavernae]
MGLLTRRHPLLVDALGAIVICAVIFAMSTADGGESSLDVRTPPVVGLLAVVTVSLVARRRWPLWTVAVTALGVAAATALGADLEPFLVPLAVATFTLAVHTDRWTARRAAQAVVLLAVPAVALVAGPTGSFWENLGRFALIGMAAAAGEAVRSRRAFIAAVEERALRAEQSREEEARRRVAEERLHIARELHDVVAHHISVINVQAAVAEHLITSQPGAAAEALQHVRRSSRSVLDELRDLLGVLRGADEQDGPAEPAPGMDRLGPLVETFRDSGLQLRWTSAGEPRPLPATVDLVAYRVVQEALTNVHRHGNGTAHLSVTYTRAELVLEVVNPRGRTAPAGGSGLGLIGIRERASAVGGTAHAALGPGDLFHVHVTLPLGKNS